MTWIPMLKILHKRIEFLAIMRITGLTREQAHFMLHQFWAWADDETQDGKLRGLTIGDVSGACPQDVRLTTGQGELAAPRFVQALVEVGWLRACDGGLELPNFGRYMGRSAKTRLLDTARKSASRNNRKSVPFSSGDQPDKNGTTVQYSTSNTPLSPPRGKGQGEDSPEGEKTADSEPDAPKPRPPRRGEILAVSDDPELAAEAKKVVRHYRTTVKTTHPNGGAVLLVMNLLASGTDQAHLRRMCDRYAAACAKNETMYDKRQGAGTFFGEQGHHDSFSDESAKEEVPTGFVMPPRPPATLNKPNRPEEMSSAELEEFEKARKKLLGARYRPLPSTPHQKAS